MSAEMETESVQQRGESEGASGELKKYSWEEVKQHDTSQSAWVVLHDKVYDVTKFLEEVRHVTRPLSRATVQWAAENTSDLLSK